MQKITEAYEQIKEIIEDFIDCYDDNLTEEMIEQLKTVELSAQLMSLQAEIEIMNLQSENYNVSTEVENLSIENVNQTIFNSDLEYDNYQHLSELEQLEQEVLDLRRENIELQDNDSLRRKVGQLESEIYDLQADY